MLDKINFKNIVVAICVLFSLLTITSSGFSLIRGNYSNTELHLLMRFFVTTIALGSLLIFKIFPQWSRAKVHSIHYGATMGSIFLLVWLSGFFISLHQSAYRDIFLNYTVIYLLITLIYFLGQKYSYKFNFKMID